MNKKIKIKQISSFLKNFFLIWKQMIINNGVLNYSNKLEDIKGEINSFENIMIFYLELN